MPDPTFLRLQLGRQLRELREHAGMTADEAGSHIDVSAGTLRRIETGRVGIKRPVLMALLDSYGVTDPGHRETLGAMALQGTQRGWWARYKDLPPAYGQYIGLEASATQSRDYEALVVPGMLQTEDYARTLITSAEPHTSRERIDMLVKVRMDRQGRLSGPDPLELWAVLDESVLYREIGSAQVMADQLAHLLEVASTSNVTIQVMPFAPAAYAGMVGSFVILSFAGLPDIAYVEGLTSDVYVEKEDVERYTVVFDHLRAAALSPPVSLQRIEAARSRLSHER